MQEMMEQQLQMLVQGILRIHILGIQRLLKQQQQQLD
jgi:hypothetical protein